jgi:hypothetical protein
MGRYYYKRMLTFMECSAYTKFKVCSDKRNFSRINGHRGENRAKLEKLGYTYKLKESDGEDLVIYEVQNIRNTRF